MPITNMSKEPSIIQAADAETAHREQYPHQEAHQQPENGSKATKHSHAQHHHLHHRRLRVRQAVSIPPSDLPPPDIVPPAVTEVVQTISIIQQINVDEAGNTVGVTTYTNTSGEPATPTTANDVSQSQMPSSRPSKPVSSYSVIIPDDQPSATGSVISTSTPATSALLRITTELPQTELPTTDSPAPEIPTQSELIATFSTQRQFASLVRSINVTTLSSSSSYTTFLSSTLTSSSSRLTTSITSIPITSSTIDSILSSLSGTSSGSIAFYGKFGTLSSIETTSTFSDPSSTSYADAYPSTTDTTGLIGGGALGAPNTPLSSDPKSSNDSASESNDDPAPLTPGKMAGAVVGSLAGLAFLLVIAFLILKRIRQKRGGAVRLSTGSQQLRLAGAGAAPMTERQSAFLPIFNAFRSRPREVVGGSLEVGASEEPSFVRISGRKLPSVLQHGGDGYGGPGEVPPIPQHLSQQLNDASFYTDDTGYHGGTGENTAVSTAIAASGLAATAAGAAATQRDRSPRRSPQPRSSHSAHLQSTPVRPLSDSKNPFCSPSDLISSPTTQDQHSSPAPRYRPAQPLQGNRDGPMRNVVVASPINRSNSQHLMVSSGMSSSALAQSSNPSQGSTSQRSPGQPSPAQKSPDWPMTGNTESSGSTNYTDARGEMQSMDHAVLRRPDPLGRSHPSQDGSRGSTSRFREDV